MLDIEKLDNLPFRENRRQYHKYLDNPRKRRYYNCSDKHRHPYYIASRIIENNIGKSFDLAFSYFCTKVNKKFRYYFHNKFYASIMHKYEYGYYIDSNGNIQEKRYYRKKRPISNNRKPNVYLKEWQEYFFSKKLKKEIIYAYPSRFNNNYPVNYYGRNYKEKYTLIEDNAEYFESKKDPKYRRYFLEMKKAAKKSKRNSKYNKLSEEEFRRILREKTLKEREETRLKLEAKGMRPDAFTWVK